MGLVSPEASLLGGRWPPPRCVEGTWPQLSRCLGLRGPSGVSQRIKGPWAAVAGCRHLLDSKFAGSELGLGEADKGTGLRLPHVATLLAGH